MAKQKVPLTSTPEIKRWIRQFLVKNRQSISPRDQIKLSREICKWVIKSPEFKRAQVIAPYLGFGSEVLTQEIISASWNARKQVVIPISQHGFAKSYFALFKPGDPLIRTKFGPMELLEKRSPFEFNQIDLVLVPGLGFDGTGYRLGYGGGVYDRMLLRAKRAAHWGLFFEQQRLHRIPRDRHDVKLDGIFTEKGRVSFLAKHLN